MGCWQLAILVKFHFLHCCCMQCLLPIGINCTLDYPAAALEAKYEGWKCYGILTYHIGIVWMVVLTLKLTLTLTITLTLTLLTLTLPT